MQNIYAGMRSCRDEAGREHCFQYYILVDQIGAGCLRCENYGIMVTDSQGNEASVPSITPCFSRLQELLSLLMGSAVTPVNLPEVIQDWL